METILLSIDRDDEDRLAGLVDHAANVAGPTGATVVLGTVVSSDEYEEAVSQYNDEIDQVGADVRKQELTPETIARETPVVQRALERLSDEGVDVDLRAPVGSRAEETVRLAEEVGADSVVIGGPNRSPTGKAIFGSEVQEVLLNAPCPVTLVRDA